jgi:N-acetylglutamate synthase-like GNAT family acetyltransferase
VLAPLYAPEKVPAGQRLDVERLAADLRGLDIPARVVTGADATAEHLSKRAAPGDTVAIMSSGDYGGLHDLLLERLGDPVRPARPGDKIGQLLDRAGITHGGLDKVWSEFLVVPSSGNDEIAACVAIEHVGDDALLRMLAITPERRGEGLGYSLIDTAVKKARMEGALHLYLVTDGTQGVAGEKLGFDVIDQKSLAPAITATDEYQMARSKTATWMRKEL